MRRVHLSCHLLVGTLRFADPTQLRSANRGTFSRPPRYLPTLRNSGLAMSDAYIIEVASQAAGIVVRTEGGYRFFAATHRFDSLEGQLFRNPRQAERAAIRLLNGAAKLAAQLPRPEFRPVQLALPT